MDEHYSVGSNAKRLKEIIVKNLNNITINHFELNHFFANAHKTKMFLQNVLSKSTDSIIPLYRFEYKMPSLTMFDYVKEDYWGFFKKIDITSFFEDCDIDNVDAFVLNKMTYATGGYTKFIYESNTYEAIGNVMLPNFNENPRNFKEKGVNQFFNNNNFNTLLNLVNLSTSVSNISFSFPQPTFSQSTDWAIELYRNNAYYAGVGSNSYCYFPNNTCMVTLNNLPAGNYQVRLVKFNVNATLASPIVFSMNYKVFVAPNMYQHFQYGGGFRVKAIETYESNDALESSFAKLYNYNKFDQLNTSSGSLASAKPIFKYDLVHNHLIYGNTNFTTFSTENVIGTSLTQGGHVGYKNVTVIEYVNENSDIVYEFDTFQGRKEYTYTTPFDYPDIDIRNNPKNPIPPISNEYKRGLLLKEAVFDGAYKKLTESTMSYDFQENNITTGICFFGTYCNSFDFYPMYKLFNNYNHFKLIKNTGQCISQHVVPNSCFFGNVYNTWFIDRYPIVERFGWAKLTSKNTKEYFYVNQNTNIVENTEVYEYYNHNKKIKSVTKTDSNNQVHFTQFTYATNINSTHIDNRVAEVKSIQNKLNNIETSFVEVIFNNQFGNSNAWLPKFIASSKGNGFTPIENKVQFLKYNLKNKPIEMKQENGMTISYIYAYHHTLLVAKLENIAYDQIPSNLIAAIQQATDATNYNEQNVVNALNALRTSTDANMQKAMITTYVYKPLVGVTKITDPKGDTQTFLYDTFNRLKEVRDKDNNLLQESEYWYRTQN